MLFKQLTNVGDALEIYKLRGSEVIFPNPFLLDLKMKKTILFCLTTWLLTPLTINAQNINNAGTLLVIDCPVYVNPQDTLFQKFFAADSNKLLVLFCVAMPQAKFYTHEELIALQLNLDKAWNPNKYFTTQNEYDSFVEIWSKQLAAEQLEMTERIKNENELRPTK